MEPTKFELAIGYSFRNKQLKRAIQHHASVLHKFKATARYGCYQYDLAYKGDTLLQLVYAEFFFYNNIIYEKSKIAQIRSRFVSNKFLNSCIKAGGLSKFHKTDNDSKHNSTTLNHRGGTFFEAIIWGIYIDSGRQMMKVIEFCKTYYFPYILNSLAQENNQVYTLSNDKYEEYFNLTKNILTYFNNNCSIIISPTKGKDLKQGTLKGHICFHTREQNLTLIQHSFTRFGESEREIVLQLVKKAEEIIQIYKLSNN